jgi:hypothetical protein
MLRGEKAIATDTPADGTYTARLERAERRDASGMEKLVTEWSAGEGLWWSSWRDLELNPRFPQGLQLALELLDGLGVDRSQITDDDAVLDQMLSLAEGNYYEVRTESREYGGRTFIDTYIESRIVDDELGTLTQGLPEATNLQARAAAQRNAKAAKLDDDKPPF